MQFNKSSLTLGQCILVVILFTSTVYGKEFEKDSFNTGKGKLTIWFIGHGTLMFDFNGYIIHIDPVGDYADYSKLPKADLILVTHEHGDHLDPKAISTIEKSGTKLIVNKGVFDKLGKGSMMKNGDEQTVDGIGIKAVPAYNTTNVQYHPKGRDNGYILQLGDKQVYVAGDTEDIPEMSRLKNIDIAFLPVNQPYTMTPAQAAQAAKSFYPKILYPYHYGKTDIRQLKDLLQNEKEIDVRIRQLQ